MRRLAAAVLLATACPLLGACIPDVPSRELIDWELEVDGQRSPVTLPEHLGHGLDQHSNDYTLRAHIELDEAWRGQMLVLGISLNRSLITLRVNGHEIPYLDEHVLDVARTMGAHRWRIDSALSQGGTLDLELSSRVRLAEASWFDVPPTLSIGAYGDRRTRLTNLWNQGAAWISMIALSTLALVYWLLHVSAALRHAHNTVADNKNTEFAKLAAGGALYAAVQVGILQPVLGRRDLALIIISLVITMKASIQLVRKYLGLPILPRWTAVAVALLTPALLWVSDMFLGTGWVIFMVALIGGLVVWVVVVTCMSAPAGTARFELWGMIGLWTFITICSSMDMLRALGWAAPTGGFQLTCAAMLVFVDAQAIMLSRDHTALLLRQQALNGELANRVTEVERLNEELRRKVGDRSRELSTALRKLRVDGEGDMPSGTVLADRYRVVSPLGAGAMGAVYRVERLSDGRSLAAKVVRGRVRPDTLERFTREAELTARVDHDNVVRVFDVDVTSDGELFLVMELVDGRSLEDERARFGDPAFAEAVVRQIANALAAIHQQSIVHRDLKPSNVLVSMRDGPHIKVADFGIAGFGVAPGSGSSAGQPRMLQASALAVDDAALDATIDAPPGPKADPRLTATGAIMGTPLYMAPEVLHGATVGPEADLFSLGLIAYQMFGGPPIEREGTGFRKQSLASFGDFAAGLPPALADALQRCLHKDPTRRPTAQQLVELFGAAAARAAG